MDTDEKDSGTGNRKIQGSFAALRMTAKNQQRQNAEEPATARRRRTGNGNAARSEHHPGVEAGESGQAAISLVLILGLFLLGIFGFAVDLTNVWFHRQAAEAAADAACQAGALDLVAEDAGLTPPAPGFTAGQAGDCVGSPAATMCTYAGLNGYAGAGLQGSAASNAVSWSFPATVPGVTAGVGSNSFLRVTIAEKVRTYFSTLLTGSQFLTVNVVSTCGLTPVLAPAPMVVLNPTAAGAFTYSGGGALDIVGGPSRGLQVNSSSADAIAWAASGMIDLSAGGPNQTGSDAAVVGGPAAIPTNGSSSGYNGGSTGSWRSNVLPVADPFGAVPAPSRPAAAPAAQWVQYGTDGCPDHSNNVYVSNAQPNESCKEFYPGYYASGLNLPSMMNNYSTAILAPGVYYLNGSFVSGGSNTVRVASPAGTQRSDGVMLYFLSGSLNLSGGVSGNTIDKVPLTSLTCDGSVPPAALGLPAQGLSGNVLIAQCAANGTYFDSAGDTTDSRGSPGKRGLLAFQDHGNTTQPSFTGSGALAFAGALYFHSSGYSDVLNLSGGASTGTYILGEIITDQVNLSGSGAIKLALDPAASIPESKVGVFE